MQNFEQKNILFMFMADAHATLELLAAFAARIWIVRRAASSLVSAYKWGPQTICRFLGSVRSVIRSTLQRLACSRASLSASKGRVGRKSK